MLTVPTFYSANPHPHFGMEASNRGFCLGRPGVKKTPQNTPIPSASHTSLQKPANPNIKEFENLTCYLPWHNQDFRLSVSISLVHLSLTTPKINIEYPFSS